MSTAPTDLPVRDHHSEREPQIADELLIDQPDDRRDPGHQLEDLEEEQTGEMIGYQSDRDWLMRELDRDEEEELEGYSSRS